MKTIVGLYEDITDAQNAINDLVRSGFARDDISLVASNQWADETESLPTAGTDAQPVVDPNQLSEDVAAGMATGGVVGGLGGVLLGLGALAIPGIGPIVAAGPLVAGLTGAGIGAAVGGLVGALVNWGVPSDEAELYAESVRRGSILVGLKADESRVEQAAGIMKRYDPIDIERRSEYWRNTGWTGHDASSDGWTPDQMKADQMNYSDYLDYSTYTPTFRDHFTTTYGNRGHDYVWYDPAYRYGYDLAHNERYADYDTWDDFEADAKSGWANTEYAAGHAWDDIKDAVREGWEKVKDVFDFDSDFDLFDEDFREHYRTQYGKSGHDYDYYVPGYRYGYGLAMDDRWDDRDTWDKIEMDARREWEGMEDNAGNAWDDFKDAIRRGWEDVRDALDMEDDYAEREPNFRTHYTERYGSGLRDYDWYEPAYRYGYASGLDERYDSYRTWDDQLEGAIRRDWEAGDFAADSTWDEIKDAVRSGWESVRDAFDGDDDWTDKAAETRVGGYTSQR